MRTSRLSQSIATDHADTTERHLITTVAVVVLVLVLVVLVLLLVLVHAGPTKKA